MNKIKIMRAGTFKAADGIARSYTTEQLKRIAEKYNAGEQEAPLVVGHPKVDAPAYGHAANLEVVGDALFASPKNLDPEFKELVNAGRYNKVSVKLRGDDLIHIGFLGAAEPGIKGLGTVQFSSNENDTETEEIEFNAGGDEQDPPKDTPEAPANTADFDALSEKLKQMEQRTVELEALLRGTKLEKDKVEFAAKIDEKITAMKLAPAKRDILLKAHELTLELPVEFNAGEKNTFLDDLIKAMELPAEFNAPAEDPDKGTGNVPSSPLGRLTNHIRNSN